MHASGPHLILAVCIVLPNFNFLSIHFDMILLNLLGHTLHITNLAQIYIELGEMKYLLAMVEKVVFSQGDSANKCIRIIMNL